MDTIKTHAPTNSHINFDDHPLGVCRALEKDLERKSHPHEEHHPISHEEHHHEPYKSHLQPHIAMFNTPKLQDNGR